eukprot:4355131-Prymnesium_polylepis.1
MLMWDVVFFQGRPDQVFADLKLAEPSRHKTEYGNHHDHSDHGEHSKASESLLSSGSVGYESVAVQSLELRSTTAMQKGQAWRQRRDRDPERA